MTEMEMELAIRQITRERDSTAADLATAIQDIEDRDNEIAELGVLLAEEVDITRALAKAVARAEAEIQRLRTNRAGEG